MKIDKFERWILTGIVAVTVGSTLGLTGTVQEAQHVGVGDTLNLLVLIALLVRCGYLWGVKRTRDHVREIIKDGD